MALIFEYEKDFETGEQPQVCHEPDSSIYNYYIKERYASDTKAENPFGQYDNIVFSEEGHHLTQKLVDKIGVRNFPGIGGIGFFKYPDGRTMLICPIHNNIQKYEAPILAMTTDENSITFSITPPQEDIGYTCYRIVLDNEGFTYEYITYELTFTVPKPDEKGTYTIYCIGYKNEGEKVSYDSNILTLEINTNKETFEPKVSYYTKKQVDEMFGNIGALLDKVNEKKGE